jgi:hypothetical protein
MAKAKGENSTTKLNRRELVGRGALVLAAAGVAALPAIAANCEDAELFGLGEQCKALALETARFRKNFRLAADQTEKAFYKMNPERWCCHYPSYQGAGIVCPVPGEPGAWRVSAVDGAARWFDTFLDIESPERLPEKWIRLQAQNEKDAKEEARVLSRRFDREFDAKRKQSGVPFNRDGHYDNWTRSHNKLRRAVARLAKLRATTMEGLAAKAVVLAIAHDAFDEPSIWNEPLQKSITRDIKGMAGGVDLAAQVERW